ncbi:transcription factor HES-5-like [Alosa sapidissima]|uniref:transcription factor HES-5-like n=1 Tax=Alosa sapidissima TaxID=34773 RepID=UPI001C09AEC1|nr:transcription factor HES-5-like [Alosa sapidissima]
MAPIISMDFANPKLSNKEKHKLRKPVVEKMRRDRINSSIEQLKAMLEKEFHKQDPNTKLEKADILEMTVAFMKQQLQSQSSAPQQAHSDGYSQCWRETLHFLSINSKVDTSLLRLSQSSPPRAARDLPLSPVTPKLNQMSLKQGAVTQKSVWRPW